MFLSWECVLLGFKNLITTAAVENKNKNKNKNNPPKNLCK